MRNLFLHILARTCIAAMAIGGLSTVMSQGAWVGHTSWGGADTSSGITPDPKTAVVVSGQLRSLQMYLGDGAITIPWRETLTLHDIVQGFGGFADFAAWLTIAEPGKAVVRYRGNQMNKEAFQKATKIPRGAKVHFGWIS